MRRNRNYDRWALAVRLSRRSREGAPGHWRAIRLLTALLVLGAGFHPTPAFGADVFYGKATAVRSAVIIVVDHGNGQYEVRLAGIDAPREGPLAAKAKEFVSNLVLGKDVRARFEYRNKSGEMVSRLFTGVPGVDVGVELLKAGLARRQKNYDYKYGELSAAEREAKEAKRGLWAASRPK